MPPIRYSRRFLRDVLRLYDFLAEKNPEVASKAIQTILRSLKYLEQHPGIGRHTDGLPSAFKEWIIPFGRNAYVIRYHITEDAVVILTARHSREAGL